MDKNKIIAVVVIVAVALLAWKMMGSSEATADSCKEDGKAFIAASCSDATATTEEDCGKIDDATWTAAACGDDLPAEPKKDDE